MMEDYDSTTAVAGFDGAVTGPPASGIVATRSAVRASSWRSTAAGGLPVTIQQQLPFTQPSFDHLDARAERATGRGIDVEGLSPATAARWRVSYRAFRRYTRTLEAPDGFLSGDVRRQRVVLEGWIASMRLQGLTRNAIATYWRGLGALLARVAHEDGSLNPLLLVPAPRENLPQPSFLTRERAEKLLHYLANLPARNSLERTRNLCVTGLLLLAGLRRQEALNLWVDDVQLETGTLRIRAGKGRNGGRPRTAYMTPQLGALVRTYLVERQRHRRVHPELLTALDADRAMGVTALRRIFRRARNDLGTRVTPHMLRHTYATLLRQSGVPDRVSMELLGHQSPAMLHRYSHVLDGEPALEASRLRLRLEL